jgi:cytochrome b
MQPQVADRTSAAATVSTMAIWDPLVRVAHWSIVAGFFLAYFTEDDVLTLHVWAGYAVGVLVLLRIVWGFVGPQHARFSDFLYRPSEVVTYLRDLLTFRATRYLGHSPAGAAMVFALLAGLTATAGSGLVLYAIEDNAGPLALSPRPTRRTSRARLRVTTPKRPVRRETTPASCGKRCMSLRPT